MMRVYDNIKNLLYKEMDEIVQKDAVSQTDLENLYKMIDIVKDICEIAEKEEQMESGYSTRWNGMMPYDDRYYNIHSYRGGNGNQNGYSSNNYGSNNNGGMRYSRTDGRDHMINNLYAMMDQASSDAEKNAIQECINRLKG